MLERGATSAPSKQAALTWALTQSINQKVDVPACAVSEDTRPALSEPIASPRLRLSRDTAGGSYAVCMRNGRYTDSPSRISWACPTRSLHARSRGATRRLLRLVDLVLDLIRVVTRQCAVGGGCRREKLAKCNESKT